MRVLAIRGQGLASLAAPFEISLAEPPLADTGLFAITGDTGAGKSTILDALCLALYADYPRATAVRSAETVIDYGESRLRASDPRTILRRGAAFGFAEVDFIGRDARSYRARWQVRRARGRAAGTLQDFERTLHLLESGEAVATGKRDVAASIEERTGFTFDQFRRTVLLAQGEFDAFLLADEPARAELLEKITGTEIYARISTSVFDMTDQRRRALALAEQMQSSLVTLEAGAREALETERKELDRQLGVGATRIAALRGAITHGDAVLDARAKLAEAEARHGRARAAAVAEEPERRRLLRHRSAEGLRSTSEEARRRRDEVARAAASVREAENRIEATRRVLNESEGRAAAASSAAGDADRRREELAPVWQLAEALDTRIQEATNELDRARAELAAASLGAERHEAMLAGLRSGLADAEAVAAEHSTRLEARARHAPIAQSIDVIRRRIGEYCESRDSGRSAADELARTNSQVRQLRERIEASMARAAGFGEHRARAATRLEEQKTALGAIKRDELRRRNEHLGDLAARLDRAADRMRVALAARTAAARAEASIGDGTAALEAQRAELSSKAASLHEAGKVRAALQPLVDLADAAASAHAADLRSRLIAGEPCPVCGAAEHPAAREDGSTGRLAAEIRARREALDGDIAALAEEQTRLKGRIAGLEAAMAVAEQALASESKATAAAERELAEELHRARQIEPVARLALALPGSITPDAADAIHAALARIGAERAQIAAGLDAAESLDGEISRQEARLKDLDAAIETETRAGEDDRTAVAAADRETARLSEVLRQHEPRCAAIASELEPFLDCAGITAAELTNNAELVGQRLASLATEHEELSRALERRTAVVARAAQLLSEALPVGAEKQAARRRAETAATERARKLGDLASERARLLDGKPVGTHRMQTEQAVRAAREASEEARRALDEARSAQSTAIATLEAATAADASARQALGIAQDRLALASAGCGLGVDEVEALLAVPPADWQAIEARIAELDGTVSRAETERATWQRELQSRLAEGPEPTPASLAIWRDELVGAERANRTVLERIGAVAASLEHDDVAQERAKAATAEVDKARQALETWEAVNVAIGQRDGSKFRRFAQGVTLGHLVHLANQQLATLSPRYRLRQGRASDLGLEIIDRDMGDEMRGVRSLSGGERFLVSLGLALALSGLDGRQAFVDTLFIDEGFGSLDREALDVAVDALETLQGQGRKVGVVTHVAAMIERIPVRVSVEKRGGGRSIVRIPGWPEQVPRATAGS